MAITALRQAVPFAKQRPRWVQLDRELSHLTTMRQFADWVEVNHPPLFLMYQARLRALSEQFAKTSAELGLDLCDCRFLDLGPGMGEAMDGAWRMGAEAISFTELDPVFFHYNRLKGFGKGYRINQVVMPAQRITGPFDVIWARGSVVADQFEPMPRLQEWWLRQLDKLGVPGTTIAIVPYFAPGKNSERALSPVSSSFATRFLDAGYEVIDSPSLGCGDHAYPVVYRKIL